MNIPKIEDINNPAKQNERYIKKNYYEFWEYVKNNFLGDSFNEKLYCYFHNIKEQQVCVVCNSNVKFISFTKGFSKYCSKKCVYKSEEIANKKRETLHKNYGDKFGDFMKNKIKKKYGVENVFQLDNIKQKIKKTNLEKYGVENVRKLSSVTDKASKTLKEKCFKKYGVTHPMKLEKNKEKLVNTNLEKYGVKCSLQNEEIDKKSRKTCLEKYGDERFTRTELFLEKQAKTCLERYGYKTNFGSENCKEKTKKTCLERYGNINYSKSDNYKMRLPEILKKSKETKDKNHTHNSSSIEEQFNAWLIENKINFKRQYSSDKYPFCCDFYFPDTDLYFEINGHWTHGGHIFNCNDENDIKKLEDWKLKETEFYNNAIKTWTIRDVEKAKTAIKNKLNYKVVYSCKLSDLIKEYKNTKFDSLGGV